MPFNYSFTCPRCGFKTFKNIESHTCPICGEPLLIELTRASLINRVFLPKLGVRVHLGEGSTPLVTLGKHGIYLKLEYMNPSGSFKDRGASLAISRALELGKKLVIEDSSGNAGLAYAVYAAYSGLRIRVYVPKDAPPGKLNAIRAVGADVVKADTRNLAREMALKDEEGYYVGHTLNPFFIEGVKILGLELAEEVPLVDTLVVPVAAGTIAIGVWKAFKELKEVDRAPRLPKLIAVQVCGYDYLSKYLKTYYLSTCGEPSKLADGLRLTDVPRTQQIVNVVRESQGFLVVVVDDLIGRYWRELLSMGLIVEPTSAVAYAAARELRRELGEKVVVPLTGSGLKYLPTLDVVSAR